MNKEERIANIEEIGGEDLKFDLPALRVKELEIIQHGLTYDTDLNELKALNESLATDVSELNAQLAEAESVPRDKNAPTVVGEVDGVEYVMTVRQARVNIKGFTPGIYDRDQVKATSGLLAALVKMGAGYLVAKA